jgi:DNA-binding CsgD family transcriptional regulator
MGSAYRGSEPGDILDLLYQATGNPEGWTEFVKAVMHRLEAQFGGMMSVQPGKTPSFHVEVGMPEEGVRLYNQHYAALDPWFRAAGPNMSTGVKLGTSLCPERQFVETEFYRDFMRHYGVSRSLGAIVELSESAQTMTSFLRAPNQEDFGPQEVRFLEDLFPHLRRAVQIHRKMLELQGAAGALNVLDAFDIAIIGLDTQSRIRFMNREAESLVHQTNALRIIQGKLVATSVKDNDLLLRKIRSSVALELSTVRGGPMTIQNGSTTLHLSIMPYPSARNVLSDEPLVMITIHDPAAKPKSRASLLSLLFGITPAEARVTMLLVSGMEPSEIAEQCKTTAGTVRFQLKSIYRKTGVGRQTQLVRLVSRLPGQV